MRYRDPIIIFCCLTVIFVSIILLRRAAAKDRARPKGGHGQ